MHDCANRLCDTPHYEADEHPERCACLECHELRHMNFSHVGLCDFCDDEEIAEIEAASETVFMDVNDLYQEPMFKGDLL